MGSSFQNKQRTGLVAAVAVMLFTLAGCSTLPEVKPPDPTQSDVEGQIRQFKGFTPQQVLTAAEEVLRRHLPGAKFVRSADTLKMETHHGWSKAEMWGLGLTKVEKWAVCVREGDQVTVASVANVTAVRDIFLYDLSRSWHVDYGMFWHRVQSILTGAPWPECVKGSELFARYFEPLCGYRTRHRYEAK
jgi:hypothetical protein